MSRRYQQVLMLVPSIAIGVAVPVAVLFTIGHGLDALLGAIVIVFSLLVAGALGIVGLGISATDTDVPAGDDQTVKTLRASQRAMLEEMDQVVELLENIRDTLRSAGDDGD